MRTEGAVRSSQQDKEYNDINQYGKPPKETEEPEEIKLQISSEKRRTSTNIPAFSNRTNREDKQLRRMFAYFAPILFVVSASGSLVVCYIMKSPWPLVISEIPALILYRIVCSLFPIDRRQPPTTR